MGQSNSFSIDNFDVDDLTTKTEEFHFARLAIDDALKGGWFTTPEKEAEKKGLPTRAEALLMLDEWGEYIDTLSEWLQAARNAKWDYWKRVFYPPDVISVHQKGAVIVDFSLLYWELNTAIARAGDPDNLFRRHRPYYKLSYKTISEEIGISAASVGHWHSGKAYRTGNPGNAKKIAEWYGVSVTRAFFWNLPGRALTPVYPDEHQTEIVYPPVKGSEGKQS